MPRVDLDRAILAAQFALRPFGRALIERCPEGQCFEGRLGLRFEPGARVWDFVTESEVEIVAGTRENYIAPPGRRP
jgi:hypothetical protein